jgi:hypothetical protein
MADETLVAYNLTEANARLILAAPDMKKELEDYERIVSRYSANEIEQEQAISLLEKLWTRRAAIAKANCPPVPLDKDIGPTRR